MFPGNHQQPAGTCEKVKTTAAHQHTGRTGWTVCTGWAGWTGRTGLMAGHAEQSKPGPSETLGNLLALQAAQRRSSGEEGGMTVEAEEWLWGGGPLRPEWEIFQPSPPSVGSWSVSMATRAKEARPPQWSPSRPGGTRTVQVCPEPQDPQSAAPRPETQHRAQC